MQQNYIFKNMKFSFSFYMFNLQLKLFWYLIINRLRESQLIKFQVEIKKLVTKCLNCLQLKSVLFIPLN
jgi:hypothetical protein